MAQIFRPRANAFAKIIIFGAVFFLAALFGIGYALVRSPYATGVGVAPRQPVPFSHKHHVNSLGIDCRYCHTSVENSSFAGIPPTETCMTCHSQLWTNAEMLEPVRASLRTGTPLRWTRVHDLPDFVYFNHSIHIHQGIGCVTCHGRVDQMPLTWQVQNFHMRWCLDCHRAPERFIRPREHVFELDWKPPENQLELGRKLVEEYNIHTAQLTDCSICHR